MTNSMFVMIFLMTMQYLIARADAGTKKFTLEEVVAQNLNSKVFNGTWTSGTQFLYTDSEGNVMLYDVITQSASLLANEKELADYIDASYILSPDGRYLLITYAKQELFRYSYVARYVFYDLQTRVFIPLRDGELLQQVVFAPIGNSLAYVFKNDVYYKQSPEESEHRITYTGECGMIFNGVPDWIYEEEVTEDEPVMSFSPDSRWLIFATFNDTKVKTETITLYGEPGTLESQYSKISRIHYPKPGTPIPVVTVHAMDLKLLGKSHSPQVVEISAPIATVTEDNIASVFLWVSADMFAVVWTNRVQNVSVMVTCRPENGVCQKVYTWTEKEGWVKNSEAICDNKGRVVTVLPQPQGPGEGKFDHLTLLNASESVLNTGTPLTRGRSVVKALYGWDYVNDIIYYQATPEDEPTQLHVYALSMAKIGNTPKCLSCNIKSLEGNLCRYASASFSTDQSYMALTCSGPDPSEIFILKGALTFQPLTTWESNLELRELISDKSLPIKKDMKILIEDGMFAQVRLYLPPDADLSGNTKYPLLVNVYGGPDSSLINDEFSTDWETYLVTNRSIIYAMIDGRGTGLKGNKMKFGTYRRLGTNEIYDQINITRELQNTYPYIDRERTAIWGWSYGGYATAMALARDDGHVFKCGISVAPVASWIYYDSTYTERYMGLPTHEDNLEGYNNGDLTQLTEGFRNKSFFLIHGNADDNVHYLQAMMLSRALELNQIMFMQQSYPNEDHSLKGVRPHLYLSMDQFWTRCFGL